MNCLDFLQTELKSSSKVQLTATQGEQKLCHYLADTACSAHKQRVGVIIRGGLLLSAMIGQTDPLGKTRPFHPELKQNTSYKKVFLRNKYLPQEREVKPDFPLRRGNSQE